MKEQIKQNNQIKNEQVKIVNLFLVIILIIMIVTGGTFAYFAFTASNNIIGGNAGTVNLTLNVTKVLPNTETTDNILITSFNELPANLNASCIDGEYALCQVYKINLANATSGVNTDVKGSLAFDNDTVPNLSWVYLGNSYSSSTTYTSEDLGNTFNTASSTFTNFIDSHLLTVGNDIDFYILVWVNESEEEQTDEGSYSGTVRFDGSNGEGVTANFSSN